MVEKQFADPQGSSISQVARLDKAKRKKFDPRLLIAGGVVALVALAGIVIYYKVGTKVEIKDGTAKLNFDKDGKVKSLEVSSEKDGDSQQ